MGFDVGCHRRSDRGSAPLAGCKEGTVGIGDWDSMGTPSLRLVGDFLNIQ